ncbi:MAG: DNA glycosylase AlkZ-like family protein [Chloroflexota bacterium]
MTLSISPEEARRFLERYHFTPTDVAGVIDRLGTIQYDPLKPLGCNPDLVLQARVPDYRVDDWHQTAYQERLLYDAWDKQACLVPSAHWAKRAPIRTSYHGWHDREVLDAHPEAVQAALGEIDARGPLSSLEFEDRSRAGEGHSWYGPTRIKRILRALWLRGVVVTHHRQGTRHYYDRPERVIPAPYLESAEPSLDEFHRWIVLQRHRAVGLLRRSAEPAIWSACGEAATRLGSIEQLVEEGDLTPIRVGSGMSLYHVPASEIELLDRPAIEPRAIILAPLDSMMWDRKAIEQLYDFKYSWEVYKPAAKRQWGYYVLPVLYDGRFIGRIDSRLEDRTWVVSRWWWEANVRPDMNLLDALSRAAGDFKSYLRATKLKVDRHVDPLARRALRGSAKPSN